MASESASELSTIGRELTPAEIEQAQPFLNRGFSEFLGLRFSQLGPDRVAASWTATPAQFQPAGLVHGGIYCSVIESLASIAGMWWLAGKGTVVGTNNSTDFIRAAREGELTGVATPIHRGRTQQLWLVEITDTAERLIARGQVRLANLVDSDRLGR